MEHLEPDWITRGHIDLEYKKYLLLGYLQSVSKHFDEECIYPFLSELIVHYRNLVALKETKSIAEQFLPKQISRIDLEQFKLEYERSMFENDHLEIIHEILEFAIPRISFTIDVAREIYETVEENITIRPVGIIPLYSDIGYLLFRLPDQHETLAFQYTFTVIENQYTPFRGLKTTFIKPYPDSFGNYEEAIKTDLIQTNKSLPNPATFSIVSRKPFPFKETFLPVAKRCFVRHIAKMRA